MSDSKTHIFWLFYIILVPLKYLPIVIPTKWKEELMEAEIPSEERT